MPKILKIMLILAVAVGVFWLNFQFLGSHVEAISMFSSLAALAMPFIKGWTEQPVLRLCLKGPRSDNGHTYWGIQIRNSGGLAEEAAAYCVAFRDGARGNFVPLARVRLEWAYEATGRVDYPKRSIDKADECDLFSDENGGRFHLTFHPTMLKKARREVPLFLKLVVYARGYCSKEFVVKISWNEKGWRITESSAGGIPRDWLRF